MKRINLTLTESEYNVLRDKYSAFIADNEWKDTPPSITGYATGALIMALGLTKSKDEDQTETEQKKASEE